LGVDDSPALQPLASDDNFDRVFVIADQLKVTAVNTLDGSAITTNGSLIIEVRQPMIRKRLGTDLIGNVGYAIQSPGTQDRSAFEHEIPVAHGMVVFQQDESWHRQWTSNLWPIRIQ